MLKRKQYPPGAQKLATAEPDWRRYQNRLRNRKEQGRTLRRIPKYIVVLALFALLIEGGFKAADHFQLKKDEAKPLAQPVIAHLDRNTLRTLMGSYPIQNLSDKEIELTAGPIRYQVHTTIDTSLQKAIRDSLDTKYAKAIGIVVIEPNTGRVLAMVSHDNIPGGVSPCLRAENPAASLFKIVTASAAMETCGFTCDTPLGFTGGKYTLYKSQLSDQESKYNTNTCLKDAFADSINPVFGSIGKNRLGKTTLEKYAQAFYFNQTIDFDLPVEPSILNISDNPYNLAEIACGLNDITRISPFHGALIAAAVVNSGKIMIPSIIESVSVENRIVYRRSTGELCRPVKPATALMLRTLMNATITEGTAQKAFRGKTKDTVLIGLDIGGKTGSINNNPERVKFDWFAGFAEDLRNGKKIAVCVMVAHKDFIGTRSAAYFRNIITEYYKKKPDMPPDTPKDTPNVPEKETPA